MKKSTIILIVILLLVIIAVGGYKIYLNKHLEIEYKVGGCAGVHMSYWQECCDNWAAENNIAKIQCVGNWTVENDQCKWVCASEEISSESKISICNSLNEKECSENSEDCFQKYDNNGEYDKCLPLDYYSKHCIEEGDSYITIPHHYAIQPKCCEGLDNLAKVDLEINPNCEATAGGSSVCVKKDSCGDSECIGVENKCNCPEDCE